MIVGVILLLVIDRFIVEENIVIVYGYLLWFLMGELEREEEDK